MMSEGEQEELLSLVAELTDLYTSRESTSITYERARILMDAVLYCIEEARKEDFTQGTLATMGQGNLKTQYECGYQLVIEKVKKISAFYNKLIPHFCSYGNRCYYDTIVKGMPEFFIRYGARFSPQDHLLTLDYPLLQSFPSLLGVDLIEQYLFCIGLEQSFLYQIGEATIRELMGHYDYEFEEVICNVCSPILRYKIILELLGKEQQTLALRQDGLRKVEEISLNTSAGELLLLFRKLLKTIIEKEYQGQEELYRYLSLDLQDFVIEVQNAAKYHSLKALFPV